MAMVIEMEAGGYIELMQYLYWDVFSFFQII